MNDIFLAKMFTAKLIGVPNMTTNPSESTFPEILSEHIARMETTRNLVGILLAKLDTVLFRGAALGLDDFSSEELTGRYRRGFELTDHIMVFDAGLSFYLFDTVEQMDEMRGEFGPGGITAAYAIPTDMWNELAANHLPSECVNDFRKTVALT